LAGNFYWLKATRVGLLVKKTRVPETNFSFFPNQKPIGFSIPWTDFGQASIVFQRCRLHSRPFYLTGGIWDWPGKIGWFFVILPTFKKRGFTRETPKFFPFLRLKQRALSFPNGLGFGLCKK